jgi:hypothetical protein
VNQPKTFHTKTVEPATASCASAPGMGAANSRRAEKQCAFRTADAISNVPMDRKRQNHAVFGMENRQIPISHSFDGSAADLQCDCGGLGGLERV